jgi:hypothetical protein
MGTSNVSNWSALNRVGWVSMNLSNGTNRKQIGCLASPRFGDAHSVQLAVVRGPARSLTMPWGRLLDLQS